MHLNDPAFIDSFNPATEDEIIKLIHQSPNKQCDLDPIPTSILKQCLHTLAPSITKIVNLSISTGLFPSQFKQAIVTPLLKKPSLDKDDLTNYRPVSNLSFLSKLTEKVVKSRLDEHLSRNKMYNHHQSAYTKFCSTETTLLSVQNHVIKAMAKQQVTGLCLLDLSAAFDTIDHNILLHRLSTWFGITGTCLGWLKSYLSDRTFEILTARQHSARHLLTCGVPQGSVLGPLLFILYTSPLSHLISQSCVDHHLYADDTQLFLSFSPDAFTEKIQTLQSTIVAVSNWMSTNLLSLNPAKTEFLTIGTPQQLNKLVNPVLVLSDCVKVVPCENVRNLGFIFDRQLSHRAQIAAVCKSCYFHIRDFRRIRKTLDTNTARIVATSIVQSKLDYCNSLYLNLPATDLNRLQLIQNSLARTAHPHQIKRHHHITPVLKSLHWLKIKERIKFKVLALTYKALHFNRPTYIFNLLHITQRQTTRSASSLTLARPSVLSGRKIIDRSFEFFAPQLWNSLPKHIRQPSTQDRSKPALSPSQFRKAIKTLLFQQCFPPG